MMWSWDTNASLTVISRCAALHPAQVRNEQLRISRIAEVINTSLNVFWASSENG